MTYKEVLDYLFSQLPMYQRDGAAAYKADLKSTWDLMEVLGNPQKSLNCIHIAGTNGKGSTAHYLSSILQEQGYKTGLYTSPHFVDFRERVRINGVMISEADVICFVTQNLQKVAEIRPSFFEWTVGLAFKYFQREQIDIAVIETGMGGRLDSTNVVDPMVSVITSIGMDHMRFLGNNLLSIAGEKAGIIKKERPVVVGTMKKEVKKVFLQKALEEESPIFFVDDKYAKEDYHNRNRALTVKTCEVLNSFGLMIDQTSIDFGFQKVVENTGWRGRWERLNSNPRVVADMAHNEDGLKEVNRKLSKEDYFQLHIVFGSVYDKDVDNIIEILPNNATYHLCAADIPRSMPVAELRDKFDSKDLVSTPYDSVGDAVKRAMQIADNKDFILITGSTFVVAEAMLLF